MKQYSYLIKPTSSLCNLECKYCFYHDISSHRVEASNGIMNDSTMRMLIKKACQVSDASEVNFAFQGGEPTIAGLGYFRKFLEFVDQQKSKEQIIRYSIQTNGTLLNRMVASIRVIFTYWMNIEAGTSTLIQSRVFNQAQSMKCLFMR